VAEIIYTNCSSCHRDAGIAPFPLIDYDEDVLPNVNAILDAVGTGYMPPWTADTTYQDYAKERTLSYDEIQTIVEWVGNGSPQGDPAETPPPPVYFDEGFITAAPDLEIQIPTYVSNASAQFDDYVCISVPTELLEDKQIRAFEVIPGNTEIVHHALIYIDEEGTYESDYSGFCGGPTIGLIGGYTPGTFPTVFPSDGADFNLGVTLPAESNIVFAMHFPNGSAGMIDSTKVRFFFYDEGVNIREVGNTPVLSDWNFTIPANTVTEVTDEFDFIPVDVSLLSVFPHMHLIGEYIESYATTPSNDTIPLVRIPHWDFEWQEFYFFENMQRIPAGSTLHGKAVYENLPGNPHNPNDPPIDISAGLNTSDEMFLIYFAFLPYQEGDELIDLDALTQLPTGLYEWDNGTEISLSTSPNPFTEEVQFNLSLENRSKVSLRVYDQQGKLIDEVAAGITLDAGKQSLTWRPNNTVAPGLYYSSARVDGALGAGKILYEAR